MVFGTSGHRGSSLDTAFNEDHIAATTQAIVEYRAEPLREVHGLVWRGGLLRIESLCLTP